ncbi:hypothetical protein CDAR_609551 [Caerostris darwini]|uniref:Uncharacterized protein n=1 Tax=Caerostris darwini TaxID=1538125 RepID=A0AAV4S9L4_9ARAC|nr:hypothetical protein CDAR_609551 [Caerostris darwini]
MQIDLVSIVALLDFPLHVAKATFQPMGRPSYARMSPLIPPSPFCLTKNSVQLGDLWVADKSNEALLLTIIQAVSDINDRLECCLHGC